MDQMVVNSAPVDSGVEAQLRSLSLTQLEIPEEARTAGVRVVFELQSTAGNNNELPIITPEASLQPFDSYRRLPGNSTPATNLFVLIQDIMDIKFSIRIPLPGSLNKKEALCLVYFDAVTSNLVFINKSHMAMKIARIENGEQSGNTGPNVRELPAAIRGQHPQIVQPGTWTLTMNGKHVLDFKALERVKPSPGPFKSLSTPGDIESKAPLKHKLSVFETDDVGESVVESLRSVPQRKIIHLPSEKDTGFLEPKKEGHCLVDLVRHGLLHLPGVHGKPSYTIHKINQPPLISNSNSEVFLSDHSSFQAAPTIVKIVKSLGDGRRPRTQVIVRTAEAWLEEYKIHSQLNHRTVVKLYGGDARYLSLYQEYVPAKDLRSIIWKDNSHRFVGDREDVRRILTDVSTALEYLHSQELVHSDMKPGNILYSHERGAVLCDFGLSSILSNNPEGRQGGTPWYLPPEYLDIPRRGKADDIWALGIILLYLLKLTPLPETIQKLSSGQKVVFRIADIHVRNNIEERAIAQTMMKSWIMHVKAIQEASLGENSTLGLETFWTTLLPDMLSEYPEKRPTASDILQRLANTETNPRAIENMMPNVEGQEPDVASGWPSATKSFGHGSTTQKIDSDYLRSRWPPEKSTADQQEPEEY